MFLLAGLFCRAWRRLGLTYTGHKMLISLKHNNWLGGDCMLGLCEKCSGWFLGLPE